MHSFLMEFGRLLLVAALFWGTVLPLLHASGVIAL